VEIGTNRTDITVAIAKGVLGAIPMVGPLAAEVVGTLIPNQRLDRIERFLQLLEQKVAGLDNEQVKARFIEPGFVDLFEDGMYQAARALNTERLDYIASLIKNGLSADDTKALHYKFLLSLLGQLNDAEVVLLGSRAIRYQHDEEYWARHAQVLEPVVAFAGAPRDQHDEASVKEGYRNHLARLGLLENTYRSVTRGELPELDDRTGMMKASGRRLAPLGCLLLRTIDVLEPDEF